MAILPASPLTAERRLRAFKDALSYPAFLEQVEVNKEVLLSNYEAYQLSEDDLLFFSGFSEPLDVLVLAHDWCGDVVANLPLFGKIAAQTEQLNLHILPRDPDNQDIAALYLHTDGKSHIPTYVFFNAQGEELGVLIERPAAITEQLGQWIAAFWDAHPELAGQGKPIKELEESSRQALLAYLKSERARVIDLEKDAFIRDIRRITAS